MRRNTEYSLAKGKGVSGKGIVGHLLLKRTELLALYRADAEKNTKSSGNQGKGKDQSRRISPGIESRCGKLTGRSLHILVIVFSQLASFYSVNW